MPIAMLVAVAGASAQDPIQPPPVFKAGIDLVRLDVRVVDDDGAPIADVKPSELEIRENGRQRPIIFFQHIAEPAGSSADIARNTVSSAVSTNRGAARGNLYVIVFDQHHITAGNEQRARRAAEEFIRTRIGPGDRVAVYGIPGPGPSIDFTADNARAIAEVDKVSGSLSRIGVGALGSMSVFEAYAIGRGDELALARVVAGYSSASASSDLLTDVVRGAGEDVRVFRQLVQEDARRIVALADEEARRFLTILSDLMRTLRWYDGRKTILLFSEGFFTDHVSRELEQVAAAAAESYSVVHSFDLNSRGIDPRQIAPGAGQQAEVQSRLEPLSTLALETDGRLLTMANGWMESALRSIAAESRDYYLVGFEPDVAAAKDSARYHRIKVDVQRPGAHVSTRTGYAMSHDEAMKDRRRAINMALGAPYPLQGLTIDYTTYVIDSASSDTKRVVLSLAAELPVSSSRNATADVVFAVRRIGDGQIVASGTDTMSLPQSASPQSATGVGTFRVQFDLPAGEYAMRTIVREPGGLVGSADRRFAVRAPSSTGITAGDLLFESGEGPPLPVRTTFTGDDVIVGSFDIYAQTAALLDRATASAALIRRSTDRAVVTTRAALSDVKPANGGASRSATVEIPLGHMESGRYVVRATIEVDGRPVASTQREVEVTSQARARPSNAALEIDPAEIVRGAVAREYVASADQHSPAASSALEGLARLTRKDFAGAADAFTESLQRDPKAARVEFFLGWSRYLDKRVPDAITSWRAAAYLEPTFIPAYLALADAYVNVGQPPLAAQALRAGLEAVPNSVELRERLQRLGAR